ncbi:hypothetical protein LTR54_017494 [Friedmanniomyces endolithicus]|nr:hypothetical protein LTR54_017494 [Friedmanniomyces endolithicus]
MTTQGHQALLCDWYPTLQWLLDELDGWRQEATQVLKNDYLQLSISAAWYKIENYYKKADKMPAYYAAVVLNPTLKMQYFRDQWQHGTEEQQAWIPMVEDLVKDLWRTEYKGPNLQVYLIPTHHKQEDTVFTRLANAKRIKIIPTAVTSAAADALEQCLVTDLVPHDEELDGKFDVLQYWQDQRQLQPQLQFAFDMLSIPLMSDDNERSFSFERDTITYWRFCLHSDVIQAC